MSWAVRRPVIALVLWAVLLSGIAAAAVLLRPSLNDSFSLAGVQSTTAQQLLETLGDGKPTDATARVVWSPESGPATSAATLAAIRPTLSRIADLPYVTCVRGPSGIALGRTCTGGLPDDLPAAVNKAIDAKVASTLKIPVADVPEVLALVEKLAPLEKADPATLAAIGRALPRLAKLAQAPPPTLEALLALTPAQWRTLVGITSAEVTEALEVVGGLDRLANLPPATLKKIEDADPAALAAFAEKLPSEVGTLEQLMAELKAAIAKDPALGQEIVALAARFGITPAQLREAVVVIDSLAPIAKADPATLATIARALPQIAKVAASERTTLDALARLTPADLSFLVGLTRSDVDDIERAFGSFRSFTELPPATLAALADADPAVLARYAAGIPADVRKAEQAMAELKAERAKLDAAATATQAALSPVSKDGRVAYATVTFDRVTVTATEADEVVAVLAAASTPTLTVGGTGAPLDAAGTGGPDTSTGIGMLVALIVLLLAFGSLVAAALPLVVAVTGLVGGLALAFVTAAFMDVATFAPTLAAMVGLGVGIDYSLFVLNRFTQESRAGADPRDAARTAVGTAGRAVLFAGCTVIIALLGMFVLRISFFNGLAVAAAVTVLMVMCSALWMLPALLSLLGHRTFALRMPWGPKKGAPGTQPDPDASRWARYGALLQRAPLVPVLLALAVIGVLARPALDLELGFADDGSAAKGSVVRTGYDLMSEGFGPGVNGPFFVAVRTSTPADAAELATVVAALEATPGVASTLPSTAMLPLVTVEPSTFRGDITSVIVQPSTGPQDLATQTLLDRIRSSTTQTITSTSGAQIYVGGALAVNEDFTGVLSAALPLFLLLVVGLGFLALMLLFHSILIPLTAAVTSLLSFAAALGITVAVFQDGVAASVLGVSGTGPILPFLPIMVFAILFGLSMDYQVFLVSRMREEWDAGHDNALAVRRGLAGSGRVVVVAATIMTSVFLAFVPTPLDAIKMFGVALAAAVVVDAFLVRLVLVPSVMSLLGRSNWWIPGWLGRILPTVKLE
jgi:RND superfamily putative drug exporter